MAGFNPNDKSRFNDFNVFTTSYKRISNHDISVDVIYDKDLTSPNSSTQPIIIRFHGGGLIAADSMFPDFFGCWLLELAKKNGAVIVSANYRLLPESNVSDILEDLNDLWSWVHSSLPTFLKTSSGGAVACDPTRILTTGESAGGYLAVQLALDHPKEIRTFLGQYPMLDMKSRWFTQSFEKSIFGLPQLPKTVVSDHLTKVRAQEVADGDHKIVASADPQFDRGPLMFCMIQHGLFGEYFDMNERRQFPVDRIEDGNRLPAAGGLIWHGEKDSVVPVEGSILFSDTVNKHNPDAKLKLIVRPGDHGFDGTAKLGDEWLDEAVRPYVTAWLAE